MPSMRMLLRTLRVVVVLECSALTGVFAGNFVPQKPTVVWVNTGSGVYHCAGTLYYGKTSRGEYLEESKAIQQGFRANGGRRCAPAAVVPPPKFLVSNTEPVSARPPDKSCILHSITDADTIECEGIGSVRLIGIDAPERSQRPFGTMADSALASMLPIKARLGLEFDTGTKDRYGRTLAYVWYSGHMVNWRLVRNGWAMAYRFPPDVRWSSALSAAEISARNERLGLWKINGFVCSPANRRSSRC